MSRRRLLLPAILALIAFAAIVIVIVAASGGPATPVSPVVSVPSNSPTETVPAGQGFDGAALPAPRQAPGFSLTDQYGRRISLASLRGGPVVLAFLYARCGGPCVLIAQQIRGALDELGEHPAQVAIVSADPTGDTPGAVRSFLAQVGLSGRAHWLTGSAAALAAVWKAYDVRPAAAGTGPLALLPRVTRAAGCLPRGAGYLRARVRGAVNLDVDWHGAQLQCEGGARPGGRGIRLSFAGPLPRSGALMRLIFGIAGTGEGRAGRALPTNVTVIFEGERRLYSTRGDDKCTVDSLTQKRLGPPGAAVRRYRVVARGFCFEPVSDMMGNDRIVISRFDFAGRIDFP